MVEYDYLNDHSIKPERMVEICSRVRMTEQELWMAFQTLIRSDRKHHVDDASTLETALYRAVESEIVKDRGEARQLYEQLAQKYGH